MSVVSSYFSDLFFVTLDTPKGADIVSIDEAVFFFFCLREAEACSKSAENEFSRDIHYLINGDTTYLLITLNSMNSAPTGTKISI